MDRIIIYEIKEDSEGKRISTFLRDKGYAAANLSMLKRYGDGICLGERREGPFLPARINTLLSGGKWLRVHIVEEKASEKIIPVELPLDIMYEDEDLLVLNKPPFMPIHPATCNYDNTLANALAFYFAKKGEPFVFRCLNRLDRDTSGLTIVAKHSVSAAILYRQLEEKKIKRVYTAIAEGEVWPIEDTVDLPIGRKGDSLVERCVDMEKGERAVTHYKREALLEASGGERVSLLRLHLDTGRTHQIRVHMKHRGHPLIGDFLYNPENRLMDRQALHAGELSFFHPMTGEKLDFYAKYPADFQHFLDSCLASMG